MPAEAADATGAALDVRLLDEPPPALAALAAGPDGCFFHTPAWLAAVSRAEPRLRPLVVAAFAADGTLRAACPLLEANRFGVRRWYGGAWGTYGGIVGADPAAVAAVRARVVALAAGVALVRVHDFAHTLGAPPGFRVAEERCQVLDLPADPEVLFRDAFTSQNRGKIRKAENAGVVVRRQNDRAGLDAYAALYRESAPRWNVRRPTPAALFAALGGVPGVDVWLAEKAGEPIAGLLNFTYGGQVMNWGNASRRDAWNVAPNNLLHWRAIEAACRTADGPRLYNFGSSTGLPGVEAFKAAFGARVRSHPRCERRAGWLSWVERARRRPGG
jgi:CelD/BcsL family acetyltransferase involved in cellulose biosynthesis